jgi:hypothetical protein
MQTLGTVIPARASPEPESTPAADANRGAGGALQATEDEC